MSVNQGTLERRTLPSGWRWAKLGEILESLETGTRPKGGAIGIIKGIPSISAEQMTSHGTLDFSVLRYVPEAFYDLMKRGHIQEDDILLVKDGATTGKVCMVRPHFSFNKAVINEHVFLCRPKQELVFPLYLFFWLWGPFGQQSIRACYQGAAIGGINQSIANLVVVPLPPLSEQKRIAAILDEQMAAVERARAAAEAQLEATIALPAAYLRQVLPKEGQPLPPGWRWVHLEEVCEIIAGQSPPGHTYRNTPEGIPFFQGKVDFGPRHPLPRAWCVEPTKLARVNDILISVRAPVGPTNIADQECCIGRGLAAIRCGIGMDMEFLLFWLRKEESNLERKGSGSTFGAISRRDLEDFSVPLPPLPEQKRIAAILDEQMASAERLRSDLEKQLLEISALPAALSRKAFRGEL